MTNWYPKAIAELARMDDADAKAILFKIAQKRPKAIVDACMPVPPSEPSWVEDCRRLMRAGEKISAIKLWRNETRDGLKEAKDAVEALSL